MNSLATREWPPSLLGVPLLAALLALTACATTPRTPYVLTSGGIGVSVVSQPPASMPVSAGATGKRTIDTRGWGYFGPGALLLVPFAAAYEAARGAAESAQCDAKLKAAYPDASARFRDVLQREFMLQD